MTDGGQFATRRRDDAPVCLVIPKPSVLKEHFRPRRPRTSRSAQAAQVRPIAQDVRGAYIEKLITAGELAPAARDMDAREALEQWAEANAATAGEHIEHLACAGLLPTKSARTLTRGEAIDLEPLLTSGEQEATPEQMFAARREFAVVSDLTVNADATITITHSQGVTVVPADAQVAYDFDDNHCDGCGRFEPGVSDCTDC